MTDITPGRRRLGRGLLAAAALALPATASISYTAAVAQDAPPAPSEPRSALDLPPVPAPPAPPAPPEAPEAGEPHVRTFVIRREAPEGEHGKPVVRQFTLRRDGAAPMAIPMPALGEHLRQFQFHGDPNDPEWQERMKDFEREMEKWGEEYGEKMEQWGREFGERQGAQALAMADVARRVAPEVVHSCDEGEQRRTTTADGRARVVICQREIGRMARSSLRQARNSIAANREMSEEVRREVLEELDQEIIRLERGDE